MGAADAEPPDGALTRQFRTIVVCGPGGAGKGTIVQALLAADDQLALSRSWTTRPRRADEGQHDYVFVSLEQFKAHADGGGFLEWTEFLGNRYGTPMPDVPTGRDLLLEIDVQGAASVRERDASAVIVMVLPPSRDEQERRMRQRGDPEPIIAQRLAKADAELATGYGLADLIVVNRDIEGATDEIGRFLRAGRSDP